MRSNQIYFTTSTNSKLGYFLYPGFIRSLNWREEIANERNLKNAAAERHSYSYVGLIRSIRNTDPKTLLALGTEMDDIVLAAKWLLNEARADYEFLIRLEPLLQRYGYWQEAVTLMSGFLSVAEQTEDWNAVVQVRIQQAKYLSLRGDWELAKKMLDSTAEQIARIDQEENKLRCEAMYLNTLGGIYLISSERFLTQYAHR